MTKDEAIIRVKELRSELDGFLTKTKELFKNIPEETSDQFNDLNEVAANQKLAYRHVEDAKMRLGQVLHHMAAPNPYPKGNDVKTAEVDPQADTAGKDQ